MTSTYYNEAWYDARWESLTPVMRKLAADSIKKALDEPTQELIRQKYAEYGHDWMHHLYDQSQEVIDEMNALLPEEYQDDLEQYGWPATMSAHHGFGMQIRNLLRDDEFGAGIADDDLPEAPYENWTHEGVGPRNWDDYYIQAIEAAVGLREV